MAKAHPALLPGAIRVQLRQVDAQEMGHALRNVVLVPCVEAWKKPWENDGCGENDGKYVRISMGK